MEWIKKELQQIKRQSLLRSLPEIEKKSGARIKIRDRWLSNFCSNDYLGLANDPRVISAGQKALSKWGASACASRLVSGNFSLHLELEEKLAKFKKTEACLVFPTGYLANLGAIRALVGRDDLVFSDELNHASLIDACRLSRARVIIFPHSDINALERKLKNVRSRRRKLIVIEGIYSMDGDITLAQEILEVAEKFGAMVYLDEAHSTGVLGKRGKGCLEYFGIATPPKNLILMGTLSKALGSQGGFICCSKRMRDYLINTARSFIFSTGLNPASVAAALQALEVIEEEPERIEKLRSNIAFARALLKKIGIKPGPDPTPIIPVILGGNEITLRASQELFQKGIFVQAIRPPSVPQNSSRLRITLSAAHTPKQISSLANALAEFWESQ